MVLWLQHSIIAVLFGISVLYLISVFVGKSFWRFSFLKTTPSKSDKNCASGSCHCK